MPKTPKKSLQNSRKLPQPKFLPKLLWGMVYALPAVLFFSYYPVIALGGNQSMNFELSLPLIWLVLFDVFAFVEMICLLRQQKSGQAISNTCLQVAPKVQYKSAQTLRKSTSAHSKNSAAKLDFLQRAIHLPGISDRRFFLLALFPLYLTISIFWSANPLRGVLTAGVVWLVFCAVFAILYVLPLASSPLNLRRNVIRSLLISSVLVCVFCFVQSILDIVGFSRENTLMCAGCTYRSFGFPHPSGFAIEPQFMGNLLLAPTLTALYLLVFSSKGAKSLAKKGKTDQTSPKIAKNTTKNDQRSVLKTQKMSKYSRNRAILLIIALFLSTTLFFTFSRGAIYAYAVAVLVLLIFALKRKQFRWNLIIIPVVSFGLSLGLQGTFAALGPTAETFTSAITKSIHHLSLGIIDLRVEKNSTEVGQPTTAEKANTQPATGNKAQVIESQFVENLAPAVENSVQKVDNSTKNVQNSGIDCAKPVQNQGCLVEKVAKTVESSSATPNNAVAKQPSSNAPNQPTFDGYVAESTNIRLSLNNTALQTWLDALGRPQVTWGADCSQPYGEFCTAITPSSMLFGVGLGGAGTAMHLRNPAAVTSPKEIVQHQGFSLLLETGLVGILLLIFELLICFVPQIFRPKFLDGKAAANLSKKSLEIAGRQDSRAIVSSSQEGVLLNANFWQHPALPLLVSLIIAYLVTLNFFSGLPNALQIYLMPPLLYLIFLRT